MRLAICVAIKNRSCVIVDPEDSLSFLKHVQDKIIDCPQFKKEPMMTKDGKIVLTLMPNMLRSLASLKKEEDDWVIVVVDYKSTDVNIKEMMETEIGNKIPWHVEVVEDYPFFDRGGGLAKAAEIAESKFQADGVFFCDADLLFTSRTVFDNAVQSISNNQFYYPVFFSFSLADHSKGVWRDTSFGNFACLLSNYKKTDGWLHNVSWGWEDRALSDTIPKGQKDRDLVSGFFHQWHPMQWEFRVKEYPVKEYVFKDAAVKDLPTFKSFTKTNAVEYYILNRKEFFGEDGHETLLMHLKKHMKALSNNKPVLAIDVGACVGDYIHHLQELCPEPMRQILCFEPNPVNIETLQKKIMPSNSIRLYPCCVSNKVERASFYNWKDLSTNDSGNLIAGLRSGGTKICDVDVVRLDSILDAEWKDKEFVIKFLKVDTEGNDTNVLKGLGAYLEKTMYIIFECSDCLDDMRGPGILNPMKDIVEYLSAHGFDTYRIGTKKLLKVNDEYWDDTYESLKFWSNCFALRKGDDLIRKIVDETFEYRN